MSMPACWLWVTRPKYYLDAEGRDLPDLEPGTGFVADGWWTCDPQTRNGDLVLLYRAEVRKDMSHFLVARSDAQPLNEPGSEFHGQPTCRYEVLARFGRPLPFAELAADPALRDWRPVKIRLQGRAFPIPTTEWRRLGELLGTNLANLAAMAVDGLERIGYEKELEQRLFHHPQLLSVAGLRRLRRPERQRYLPTGRIADLVYRQGRGILRRTVVVELKKIKAGPATVRQVLDYRATLDELPPRRRPWRRRTHAVLISDGTSAGAERLATAHGVQLISLNKLNLAVAARPAQPTKFDTSR